MELEALIRDIVRSEIEAAIGPEGPSCADPELITIAETAAAAGCGKDVINALIKDAPANGFPVIHLGPKTIRIDKRRLAQWLSRGGKSDVYARVMIREWTRSYLTASGGGA